MTSANKVEIRSFTTVSKIATCNNNVSMSRVKMKICKIQFRLTSLVWYHICVYNFSPLIFACYLYELEYIYKLCGNSIRYLDSFIMHWIYFWDEMLKMSMNWLCVWIMDLRMKIPFEIRWQWRNDKKDVDDIETEFFLSA